MINFMKVQPYLYINGCIHMPTAPFFKTYKNIFDNSKNIFDNSFSSQIVMPLWPLGCTAVFKSIGEGKFSNGLSIFIAISRSVCLFSFHVEVLQLKSPDLPLNECYNFYKRN
ncbi:hypothetical protein AMTRI_Chr08g168700 [Amborella trichopoda]